MRKRRSHAIVVEVEIDQPESPEEARDRVHRWLEIYGYTSTSFGFEFKSTFERKEKEV
jgi:hypothetical protein